MTMYKVSIKTLIKVYYRGYIKAVRNEVPHTEEEIVAFIKDETLYDEWTLNDWVSKQED